MNNKFFIYLPFVLFIGCASETGISLQGTWSDQSTGNTLTVTSDGNRFRVVQESGSYFKEIMVFDGTETHQYVYYEGTDEIRNSGKSDDNALNQWKFWVEHTDESRFTSQDEGDGKIVCGRNTIKKTLCRNNGNECSPIFVDKETNIILEKGGTKVRECIEVSYGNIDESMFEKPW